ncbi:MAG: hypothetical protein ACI9VR_002836 [Cognaticolwellia sp.]|jgi:hypothetical protein
MPTRVPQSALSLLALSFAFAAPALAQEETPEPNVTYAAETEIEFTGVQVDGEVIKPGNSLISEARRAVFMPMIALREDFNVEIDQSVNQVK